MPPKGWRPSRRTRARMSEAHRGKHPSDMTRAKMAESHRGKTQSAETRKKIQKWMLAYWERTHRDYAEWLAKQE